MRKGREKFDFNNESHKGVTYEYHTSTFRYVLWNVHPPPLGILIPRLAAVAIKDIKLLEDVQRHSTEIKTLNIKKGPNY